MPLLDIVTSQPSLRNHICKSSDHLLIHYSILGKFSFRRGRNLSSAWNISIPRKVNFDRAHLVMQDMLLTRAVSTLEMKSVQVEDDQYDENSFVLETRPNPEMFQYSTQTPEEIAERERLRRMRISKANKGNVPWNKGRKHSAETLRRIRERTKLAMQDPKVKMKLVNLGHAQSDETRKKIGVGVRMGWQRRREKLMLQETCCFEWQNLIAEASRRGYSGEKELQWDSYKILDKQLDQEWLKSIEQRKSTPRPKGNKRAPKSPEQRKRISQAISAKWADPEYRGRVCSALAKYHGTPVGTKRNPPRRRPIVDGQSVKIPVKRKVREVSNDTVNARKSQMQSRPKRRHAPSYKDPLADSKLEMIKNIRVQRMAMETKKIEAMERAKLLISEAEKAAKALEVAALKSPLAQASLIETRKLIAEATRSLEAVETGQIISYKDDNNSSSELNGFGNHNEEGHKGYRGHTPPDINQVNGTYVPLPSNEGSSDFDFGQLTMQNQRDNGHQIETRSDSDSSHALQPNTMINGIGTNEQELDPEAYCATINESAVVLNGEETGVPQTGIRLDKANSTKKWVCGRLVEVTESD